MRSMMAAMLMGAAGWPAMAIAQTAPAGPPAATPATPTQGEDAADGAGGGDESADSEDIVVTGARPRGSAIGDIPPDQTLTPADVRSYGVSSIADLLTELTPQTTSGRGGPPVVLLNGKRISGFQEIRDLPAESIARVEILPEEVALKYGYSADQKVVNFVLRNRFRSTVVELAGRVPTQGGQAFGEGELDWVQIRRDKRFSLHTEYQERSALTEAERDIVAPQTNFALGGNVLGAGGRGEIDPGLSALTGSATTIAGVPTGVTNPTLAQFATTPAGILDATPFRTLQGAQRQFGTNATYAQPIFGNVAASINAQVQTTQTSSLQGLPTAQLALPTGNPFSPFGTDVVVARGFDDGFSPLRQQNNALTARLGAALNGELGRWRWTVTGAYDRSESRVATDTGLDVRDFNARLAAGDPTANPFGALTPADLPLASRNFARSTAQTGSIDALLNGRLFSLPAGDVSTSFKVGADTNSVDSRSFRFGDVRAADISRDTVNGQVNLDLPIASRTRGVLSPLRQLSLNLNANVNEVSDFGTLTSIGYGANWSPIEGLRLIANVTDADSAPSPTQLGAPQITTPNVRVFDYVRGETATVTTIGGGNPLLRASSRHVERLGLTLKPWSQTDFNLTASFTNSRTDNLVTELATVTDRIAQAFPERFLRDETGALVQLDTRPINSARAERTELRWGFNFSKPIKSQIQRQIEAYRAGEGPNPFEGLRPPGGERRREGAQ
ncbi:TonB-dependent receptor, partial [Sphingomonas sp.]|uniref:TonB-dependent receptor n=1 Tax=Sphingomonas sp. TaxID=28214 RepID=UPI0035AE8AEA